MSAKLAPQSEVFAGEDFELVTQVTAPEAEVFWFKDNAPLETSDKFEVISDGNTRKLIIHNVQPEDKGRYACAMDEANATYSTLKIQGRCTVSDSFLFFFLKHGMSLQNNTHHLLNLTVS